MRSTGAIRILIVDDEKPVSMSLAEFLRDLEFSVSITDSGETALEMLAAAPYDLVITDLRLPGMGGEAFILQAGERFPHPVFIIYTGSIGYRVPAGLEALGITSGQVFQKPIRDMNLFADAIHRMVESGDTPTEA